VNKKILIMAGGLMACLIILVLAYRALNGASSAKQAPVIKTDDRRDLLDKAKESMAKGDDDGAMKNYEILAVKYPDSPEAEAGLTALAAIYERRNDLIKAKDLYQKIIEKFPNSNDILKSQEAFDSVNVKILFSPIITPDSFLYDVQKGDTLAKIAKKFNTTIDLITRANGIKSSAIQAGKKIKISKAKFSVIVDKSQNILTLKSDGNILKTYRVSTGKDFSTPIGTFKITSKIVDPTWYTAGAVVPAGSPKNILGSRWMGISKPGYGIHGTTDPGSIGQQVTAGCVRMKNPEAEELYAIVPEETEVVIID